MILLFVIYKKNIPSKGSDPMAQNNVENELRVRNPVFEVSDQVQHRHGCTATENGLRLEIMESLYLLSV